MCCLFLSITCLGGGWLGVTGQAQANDWTTQIGKELMAPGWEEYSPPKGFPVLAYAFRFVELDQQTGKDLELTLSSTLPTQAQSVWEVFYEPALLQFLAGPSFGIGLEGTALQYGAANVYDSWLLTIEGKPLTIRLSTDYLNRTLRTQQTDDSLEIFLHPKTIDAVSGRVETAVGLQSVLPDGSLNEAHTTVWLGEDIVTPVAVVTRHYRQGRSSGYQYFALYLTCSIIPEDMLPSEARLFPMGNISGMKELMVLPEPPRTMDLWLALEYGGGSWSGLLEGMLPLGNTFDIYGYFRFPHEASYQLGMGCRLHEELTLLLLVEGGDILVGVQDGLAMTPQLYLSARLLPIEIVLSEPSVQKNLRLDWAVTYSLSTWDLWYRGRWQDGGLENSFGMTWYAADSLGVSLGWTRNRDSENRFSVGVVFR